MPSVHCYHFAPEGAIAHPAGIPESLRIIADETIPGFVWIDVDDPDLPTLDAIARPLNIHPLSVEDCLDNDQVPKIEEFSNYVFILFNSYTYENQTLSIGEIDFMLGQRFLVSVRGHNEDERNFFARLTERAEMEEILERSSLQVRQGPDLLLHVLLDFIADKKFVACESLEEEIDAEEELLLASTEKFRPNELLRQRQCLLQLRKSLSHERDILSRICRRDLRFISEKAIYSFRDIQDHLTRFFEFIEISREMITNLMELHLSLLNNQLTIASNQTNAVMKRLTLITTVFMPLTLLAGIGGMSEWSMMCGPENWRISYPLFLLGMAAIAGLNFAYLRWIKWV